MADVFVHLEPCGLSHVSLTPENSSSYQCEETPAKRDHDNLIHHKNNRLISQEPTDSCSATELDRETGRRSVLFKHH